MARGWMLGVVFVAGVVMLLYFSQRSSDRYHPHHEQATVAQSPTPFQVQLQPAIEQPKATIQAQQEALPASLLGTDVPMGLSVNRNGNLLIDAEVAAFFDYFLVALGEEDIANIRQRIEFAAHNQVGPAATYQTMDLFDRYLNAMQELQTINYAVGDDNDVKSALTLEFNIRKKHLGTHAHTLFGNDYAKALKSLNTQQQTLTTSGAAKTVAYQRAESAASLINHFEGVDKKTVQSVASTITNASKAELFEQVFGAQAATRLSKLESDKNNWLTRLENYRSEKKSVSNSSAAKLSFADEQALLNKYFNDSEQLRVRALDGDF